MNESTDSTTTSGVRGRASNLKKRLKEDGKQKVESGKRAAADQIAEIADAIDVARAQLDQSQPTLANYASRLADGVGGLATRLREDSLEDLYYEARRLASQHPGMFLLGSAAVGLVVARFMKASSDEMGDELGDEFSMDDEFSAEEGPQTTAESETQQWGEATQDIAADVPGVSEAPLQDRAAGAEPYGSTPPSTPQSTPQPTPQSTDRGV